MSKIKTYKCTILGYKTGINKKTSKAYYTLYFSCKYDDFLGSSVIGEEVATQSISPELFAKITTYRIGDIVDAIVTRNGFNLSIYEIIEELNDDD